jgi:hypothetical protein
VLVAKRTAGALASCAGFGLSDIDDLNIAVAQACEKAIAAGDRMWGAGNGLLRLTFQLVEGGMELEVKSLPKRTGAGQEDVARGASKAELGAEDVRRAATLLSMEIEAERLRRLRAQAVNGAAAEGEAMTPRQMEDVAVNMIRLFVDELRYHVDAHGSMRMRMVKYVVD